MGQPRTRSGLPPAREDARVAGCPGRSFPATTRTRLCPLHSDQQRWQTCPVGPSTHVLEDTPSCPWDVFLILPPHCRTDPNGNEYRKNVRGARSEGTLQNELGKGAQTR